jgi:hypothetical protein
MADDGSATQVADDTSSRAVSAPDPDWVERVLTGAVGLSKLSEAVAIVTGAEAVAEGIEPAGAVVEIAHMVLAVWNALELPDRTCAYQGLVYGLMYSALDMGDPAPNPSWPNLSDAPEHDAKFFEGVAQAKSRLRQSGQDGVKRRNLILLDVAKRSEKKVVNDLWQNAISEDDHLLKMFTVEWPNVGPNG